MVNTTEKIYDLSQRAKKNHAVQRWKFIYYSGEGGYRIQNMSTKGYLYVESGSTENSVRLLVTPAIYSNNSAQIWTVQYDSSGIITIVNKKSGKTITNYGANFGVDGSRMVQWPLKAWNKWVITPNGRTYSNYFIGSSYIEIKNAIDSYFMNSYSHDPNRIVTYPSTTTSATLIESMRYSDFVWINSHGSSRGVWVCGNNSSVPYDYIHPDNIGTFKNNTKWIAIQGCGQLNLKDIGQGEYNSAKNWAQTMRSTEGNRLHGILGYWGEAPKRDVELERFQSFSSNHSGNKTLFDSWKNANQPLLAGDSNWAILVYYYMKSARLNSYKSNDQDYGSLYRYAYQANTVYMDDYPLRSSSSNAGIQFNMARNLSANAAADFVLQEKPFTAAQKTKLESVLGPQVNNDSILMKLENNGRLTYLYKNMDKYDTPIRMNQESAIQTANDKLHQLGLMPQDDYEVVVSSMIRNEMDPDGTTVGETETMSYTVDYLKKVSGRVLASDEEDGIRVEVSSKGVTSINYFWRDVNPVQAMQKSQSLTAEPITQQKAMEAYTLYANANNPDFANSNPQVIGEQMLYYKNETVVPVYAFSNNGRFVNTVIVDYRTGEVIE